MCDDDNINVGVTPPVEATVAKTTTVDDRSAEDEVLFAGDFYNFGYSGKVIVLGAQRGRLERRLRTSRYDPVPALSLAMKRENRGNHSDPTPPGLCLTYRTAGSV